ncbi:MAG: hypothetical protein R3237_02885 [Nitrosopumilaceae archaeon]|nr:hypothetical protein [Nitrosopumilaceae archaeon]
MKFEKRDGILIAGIFLVILGLTPFMVTIYAVIIGAALFFGIKFFVERKKQIMEQSIGEGVCLECGFTIVDNKCPNCDLENK